MENEQQKSTKQTEQNSEVVQIDEPTHQPAQNKGKSPMRKMLLVLIALILGVGIAVYLLNDTAEAPTTVSSQNSETTDTILENDSMQQPVESSQTELFRSTYHLKATDQCPEIGNFIDVSMFDGPGSGYPDPEFSVSCSDEFITISSNNIPHTEFVQLTPNNLAANQFEMNIPRNPIMAEQATNIGANDASNPVLGDLGVMVNGVVWYGPTEAAQPDPYGDPNANGILDDCGGHHSPYHYHYAVTKCFFPDWDASQPAPIVGYALDGYPIYGATGCIDESCSKIVEFKSGYQVIGNLETYAWDAVEFRANQGEEYLDECNGRVQPDGSYGYHLSAEFPYIVGCLKGEVDLPTGGAGGGQPPLGGQGPLGPPQGRP